MYKMKRIIFEGVEEIEKRQRIDSIAIDVVLYGKNLKFKGDFETVAKGSMAALLQQFMNIPGPSAKDASGYLYDRLQEKVVLFRKLLGAPTPHSGREVAY